MAWIEKAKPIAYGELALRPWEFGQLTINEFNAMVRGYDTRRRLQLEQEATWVAHLLNATGNFKIPMTRDRLLGRPEGATQPGEKQGIRARAEAERKRRIADRRERARNIHR